MTTINQNQAMVLAPDKKLHSNRILLPFATIVIYTMILPVVILDIAITVYQTVYFSIMGIPKIKKKEYIRMERWDLKKLTLWQKINCVYCEYANGVLAWAKAVGNQTEVYSCAIRHRHALKEHEHERKFYDEKLFN